jgi:predicted alpha/beta hydrolase
MQKNNNDLTIPATDGYPLAATLIEPISPNGRVALIGSAMGVKRGFYTKYAAFLAAQGFTVLTYDYRGIGGSLQPPLRNLKAQLWQWGEQDLGGMIAWVDQRYPSSKLFVVGHSMGGQIVGLAANNTRITGMLGVAASCAYWRHWSGFLRWRLLFLWSALIPIATRLLGYMPGSRLGLGENVPAGVGLDWAWSALHPRYLVDLYGGTSHDHYAEFNAPFLSYSFEDDTFATRESVAALLALYPKARGTHRHVRSADIGADAIGHLGFFRSKSEATLWRESAAWLGEQ